MCKLVELADDVRLKSANEIVKVIQRDLKDAYGNMGRIITLMKDEDLIEKISKLTLEAPVPEAEFKNPLSEYAAILLLLLKTRNEQNIE